MASLTVGSLFSGIGGLDLGLERAGHRILWHSEIDEYACRVLKKHWPHVPNIGDVKQVNWSEVPHVDIIAGGYPCQPFSQAGKRKGKEDPRHLWPYVFDAIRALRPRFALMENVRGHLTLGFGDVLADLASCGYSAEWQIIPASAVGAPHRRDRLFFVAYPDGDSAAERGKRTSIEGESVSRRNDGRGSPSDDWEISIRGTRETLGAMAYSDDSGSRTFERDMERERSSRLIFRDDSLDGISGRGSVLVDSAGGRLEEREPESQASEDSRLRSDEAQELAYPDGIVVVVDRSSTDSSESGRRRNDNGIREGVHDLREWWETEPDVGRVAHGVPARVDRLRGLGNAVVPQVAEVVGRLIARHADN